MVLLIRWLSVRCLHCPQLGEQSCHDSIFNRIEKFKLYYRPAHSFSPIRAKVMCFCPPLPYSLSETRPPHPPTPSPPSSLASTGIEMWKWRDPTRRDEEKEGKRSQEGAVCQARVKKVWQKEDGLKWESWERLTGEKSSETDIVKKTRCKPWRKFEN